MSDKLFGMPSNLEETQNSEKIEKNKEINGDENSSAHENIVRNVRHVRNIFLINSITTKGCRGCWFKFIQRKFIKYYTAQNIKKKKKRGKDYLPPQLPSQ